jgi:redox-sensitive bicupin YhaK (pirin superfamily)
MSLRKVSSIHASHKAQPAPGLVVDRPLPGPGVDYISPFLMIDHFGPETIKPGDTGGLNPHPHRGFETVTFLLDGVMEHHDSNGGHGVIRPDGAQWMTAAAGIVHAEYREQAFAQQGGTVHGVQLWINLPRRDKMAKPGYQDLPAAGIPAVSVEGGVVRVIAGEHAGIKGAAKTFTPMKVLHIRLAAGGRAELAVQAEWNALAYALVGSATVSGAALGERQMAVFANEGETIVIEAQQALEMLLLAGEPINEPVVSWGPFVMNTREEIIQARNDYAAGRMGRVEVSA